jgi:hypothetical protein
MAEKQVAGEKKTINKQELFELLNSMHRDDAIELTIRHYGKVAEYLIIKSDSHIEEDIFVAFERVPPRKEKSPYKWYFKRKEGGWWEMFWSFTPRYMDSFLKWMFHDGEELELISLRKQGRWVE